MSDKNNKDQKLVEKNPETFKLGQKVKVVIPRAGDVPAIFEGFDVDEIRDMSKNVRIKQGKRVFIDLYFWPDGKSKRLQDSSIQAYITDHKNSVVDEHGNPTGKVLKNIHQEIKRQYEVYVSRRQKASSERKDLRVKKQAEKDSIKNQSES